MKWLLLAFAMVASDCSPRDLTAECAPAEAASSWSMHFDANSDNAATCPNLTDRTVRLPFAANCPAGCSCDGSNAFAIQTYDHANDDCHGDYIVTCGDGSHLACQLHTTGSGGATGPCLWLAHFDPNMPAMPANNYCQYDASVTF